MSNTYLTNDILVKECLMSLKNHLVFSRGVSRQYSKEFAQSGAKVGATVNIRKPSRYEVTSGAALNIQDSTQRSVALTVDKHYHVGLADAQVDRTLSLDKMKELHIDPAMEQLAGYIDAAFYSAMYKGVPNFVGVPSATALPSTLKGFTQAKAKMALLGAPKGMYNAVVDPLVEASLVEGLKGLFHSSSEVSKQYEDGEMGRAAGCKFMSSQSVAKHTIGDHEGTPAIDTTVTTNGTSTLHLDGTLGTVTGWAKEGDIITISNVYAVNPITRESTGELMQFVVTADTDSSANEIAALPISPAIYLTGPLKNVNRAPTDGDTVQIFGHATSYANVVAPQNLVFHKSAFALASVDIELPSAGAKASRAVDEDSGLSLTITEQFDIVNYRNILRIDWLGGWKNIYGDQLACRVVGQPA
jgi:hypothetical protein